MDLPTHQRNDSGRFCLDFRIRAAVAAAGVLTVPFIALVLAGAFSLCLSFMFAAAFSSASRADAPFELESENGEVIDNVGKVEPKKPPAPAPQAPAAKQKNTALSPSRQQEAAKPAPPPDKPKFKKSRPSLIKSEPAPLKPIESAPVEKTMAEKPVTPPPAEKKTAAAPPPEKKIEKPRKQPAEKTEKPAAAPPAINIEITEPPPSSEKPVKTEKPADPKTTPSPLETEKKTGQLPRQEAERKPVTPAISVQNDWKSLMQAASYDLDAESIEYNYRNKTLRSRNAVYTDGSIRIYADEIRMDLHEGLLAASGNVSVFYGSVYSISGENFRGDRLIYDVRTQEGSISGPGGATAFAPVEIASIQNYPDGTSQATVQLFPAAATPFTGRATDVAYVAGTPQDTITARYIDASAGAGMSIVDARYTDDKGKPHAMPVLTTRTGEPFERHLKFDYLSIYDTPALKTAIASLKSEYFYAINPHGNGAFSDLERHNWDFEQPNPTTRTSNHDSDRQIGKTWIRSNDILSLTADRNQLYSKSDSLSGMYSHYWFQGKRNLLRFSYSNTRTTRDGSHDTDNTSSVWLHRNQRLFNADARFQLTDTRHSQNQYYPTAPRNELLRLGNIYGDVRLEKKPSKVGYGPFLYSLYYRYYIYENKSDYEVRPNHYETFFDLHFYSASIYTEPLKIVSRLTGMLRYEWDYNVSKQTDERPGFYYFDYRSNYETASGLAGLRWNLARKAVIGADYIRGQGGSEKQTALAYYFSFAGGEKWSARLSARNPMAFGEFDIDKSKSLKGETFEVCTRLNARNRLSATWDMDNQLHGITPYIITYYGDYGFGSVQFSAYKQTAMATPPGLDVSYTVPVTPYRYYLYVYFK